MLGNFRTKVSLDALDFLSLSREGYDNQIGNAQVVVDLIEYYNDYIGNGK